MRAATLLILLMPAPVAGQDLLWRNEGTGGQVRRGLAIQAIGDTNGDGHEDMAELTNLRTAPGQWCCWTGFMVISSGRDGSILSVAPNLSPTGQDAILEWSLARAGDVDGDGIGDYCYTRYEPQLPQTIDLVVRSGRDHRVIWIQSAPFSGSRFGISTTGGFDVNGDGRSEVATVDSIASPHGTLYVYDSSGALLYQVANQDPNILVGVDLAPLGGDLDNDGAEDLLAACPDLGIRGAIVVFSGRTGSVIRTCYGEQPGDYLVHCAGGGDIDGDGVPDFAGTSHDLVAPCVTTFSGRTGQVIHSYRGVSFRPPNCSQGYIKRFTSADVDQDGVPDIVAGTAAAAFAMSGRARDEIFAIPGEPRPQTVCPAGGVLLTVLAPPPGEHYPRIVVAENLWRPESYQGTFVPGLLRAFRTLPPTAATYGQALASAGPPARMGMRNLGGTGVRLTLCDAQSGALALAVLGFSDQTFGGAPLPASLAPVGLPGMLLLASADAMHLTFAATSGLDRGHAAVDAPLQLAPAGVRVFAQWLWLDPANPSLHGSTLAHSFLAR